MKEFSFYSGNEPRLFRCDLKNERCHFVRNGHQCRRICYIGLPYCFQHLPVAMHVKIQQSTIPNAGKGLFAFLPHGQPNEVVFRNNDTIGEYSGEVLSNIQLVQRYTLQQTAPYGVYVSPHQFVDAACKRSTMSLINHGNNARANARFSITNTQPKRVLVKAIKNIRQGQEILINYGGQYGFNDGSRYYTKNYRTVY
jgi:hypothetical protein